MKTVHNVFPFRMLQIIKVFIEHPDQASYGYLIAKQCGMGPATARALLKTMIGYGWIEPIGTEIPIRKEPRGRQRQKRVLFAITSKGLIEGKSILDELQYGRPPATLPVGAVAPMLSRSVAEHNRRVKQQLNGGQSATHDIVRIKRQQRNRCAYCRKKLGDGYHIDHIIPISKGGQGHAANLQLTCSRCNQSKRARDPVTFAQSMGRLL